MSKHIYKYTSSQPSPTKPWSLYKLTYSILTRHSIWSYVVRCPGFGVCDQVLEQFYRQFEYVNGLLNIDIMGNISDCENTLKVLPNNVGSTITTIVTWTRNLLNGRQSVAEIRFEGKIYRLTTEYQEKIGLLGFPKILLCTTRTTSQMISYSQLLFFLTRIESVQLIGNDGQSSIVQAPDQITAYLNNLFRLLMWFTEDALLRQDKISRAVKGDKSSI